MSEFRKLEFKTFPYKTVPKKPMELYGNVYKFLSENGIDFRTPVPTQQSYRVYRSIHFLTEQDRNLFLLNFSEYYEAA